MFVLLAHIAVTWAFVGIIWYAQLDQYPLLKFIGRKDVAKYEQEYYRRTMPWAVTLLVIEALTAILLIWFAPHEVPEELIWLNIGLVSLIWIFTFGGCVRCHMKLECGLEDSNLHRLLNINLTRSIVWSLRGLLVLWMAAFAL